MIINVMITTHLHKFISNAHKQVDKTHARIIAYTILLCIDRMQSP